MVKNNLLSKSNMKCHYEVLDVARDADGVDIKAAYRKLALKWHPDKNLDNPELAKEQFQVLQQAYEVLSDRNERAWYDNHREQILRGSNSEFEDKSLNVFPYFTTTCFTGYQDDEKGFYAVYRNVFENIAKEEMDFLDEKEVFCEIPNFGNSKSSYELVSEFYAYWLNYSTKKSYVWLDPYDIRETRDRRYIKLVEKENKKVRQRAKKERNEEIRNLVAFARKRDKRVQAHKKVQEQKSLEDKKKRDILSKQKRLQRQQQLNESGSQPEWTKFDNVKSELEEIEKSLVQQFGEDVSASENEEQEEFGSLYCVACNKVFKTPKSFENHEFSKKHKDNLGKLKANMLEDNLDMESESNASATFKDYDSQEDQGELIDTLDDGINQSDLESEDEVIQYKRKKKKSRNIISAHLYVTEEDADIEEHIPNDHELDSNFDCELSKKSKDKTKIKSEYAHTPLKDASANKKNKKEKKAKKETENDLSNIDTDHKCVTCKAVFPSKNKLFDHLKKTKHGVYIPSAIKKNNKNI